MSIRNFLIMAILALIVLLYIFAEPWIAMLLFGFAVLVGGLIWSFYVAVRVPGGFDEKARPQASKDSGLS
ncbi:MAG TPA: hypothetical protein EYP58_04450 [bacterium (Candidatus Stahlbacteria)]|nr:hypothetical protein [Candidatus Stahlbacteria bacterium]